LNQWKCSLFLFLPQDVSTGCFHPAALCSRAIALLYNHRAVSDVTRWQKGQADQTYLSFKTVLLDDKIPFQAGPYGQLAQRFAAENCREPLWLACGESLMAPAMVMACDLFNRRNSFRSLSFAVARRACFAKQRFGTAECAGKAAFDSGSFILVKA